MIRPRDAMQERASQVAGAAFDAGVLAVLRAVFDNAALTDAGVGGDLSEADLERVRWLRQQVWGKRAYDYTPNRRRPKSNALAGARFTHKQRTLATGGRA